MILETLHPHGDPMAEPQQLTIISWAQRGTLHDLMSKLGKRLAEANSTESEKSKNRLYLCRYLILVNLCLRLSDQVADCLNMYNVTAFLDEGMRKVDYECRDRPLQLEYLKYLRKVVLHTDDSFSRSLLDAKHLFVQIKCFGNRNNLLSSSIWAIFEDLRRLNIPYRFVLCQLFQGKFQDSLNELSHIGSVKAFLDPITSKIKGFEAKSERKGNELRELNTELYEFSMKDRRDFPRSPLINELDPEHIEPQFGENDPDEDRRQISSIAGKYKQLKEQEEEEIDSFFSGMEGGMREELSSPKSEGSEGRKFEINFELGKRDSEDEGMYSDEEEMEGSDPTKKLSI